MNGLLGFGPNFLSPAGMMEPDMGDNLMPPALAPRAPIETGVPDYIAPEQGLMSRVGGFFQDAGNRRAIADIANTLAVGFGGMTLRGQGPMTQLAAANLAESRKRRESEREAQQYVDYLKSRGVITDEQAVQLAKAPRLAAALTQGAITREFAAPKETFQAVSGQQLLDAGYAGVDANKMYNVSSTGKISQVGGAGINISTGQDAFTTAQAKVIPEQISAYTTAGGLARSQNTQLMQMASMFERGVPTGRFEDTKNRVRSFAQSLGLPVDEDAISDAQTLQAFTSTLVAEELRQNKGPQTDFDARYAQSYMPSLDKDPAANKAILDYMMSRNSLTSALGQLAAGSRSTDFDKMSQLRNTLDLAANTLGAVVYVDGTPILFNEFLNAGKGQGKSIGEILREWEQLH